jgi:hypothetical protein
MALRGKVGQGKEALRKGRFSLEMLMLQGLDKMKMLK